ncbi:MAG: M3 family metallopeptidase [Candidatus Onthomorpha sp.]|nr:M3 family metallopeptidase [Bacteroidales bacterium]MDY5789127.1 M3 family metallopeptidase [Candidatus Onthomorpha sp.]MCI6645665.1 M3 family metallopeptidase [Bacteroidales bacterium]MCI7034307.1 M3 family metallopeptidase [Bacteroidales bacterium]MCI7700121.1 M3 family metallopeptidase [Bacteroidales bacterium]
MTTTLLMGQMTPQEAAKIEAENPLVKEWNTPFQTPPFNSIKTEHYKPAMLYAIEQAKQEVNAIIVNRARPDFENTIVALERAGGLLNRISGVFFNINECMTSDQLQQIYMEIIPDLTAYGNDVSMNPLLFAKVKEVYDQRDDIALTTEQRMLLEKTYKSFIRSGALLEGAAKEEYRKVSEELSMLTNQYQMNVLAEQNAFFLNITNKKDLAGLPDYVIAAAREEAKARKQKGWTFTLQYPSFSPFMQYADNRDLREKMWRASAFEANNNNDKDNKEIARKIANLRLRMAQLLGYSSYAEYALEERMAQNPQTVNKFINDLFEASMPFAEKEMKEVQDYANAHGFVGQIQRWDFSYWSEKLKNDKYAMDPSMFKPYFKLENVKKGVFDLADRLYNIEFRENKQIEKYHPDVTVYEVYDKADGKFLAVLYMDFFPRESKRSGAWMTAFREQYIDENGNDVRPLIQLVCNFTKPTSKEPSLLTFDEVNTFLHEFGHCLHGIFASGTYQSISGTSVYRDFVELPSQIMENFATEKEFLDMFAVHYKTGEKIPQELIDKLIASQRYLAGYMSVRQLSFGMIDMAWHTITSPYTGDVIAMEKNAIAKTELMPVVENSVMTTSFGHIFAGGYAAGYYGYKWAEVLDADAFAAFKEKGIFNREVSTSFRKNILSQGGKKHPMELYKAFRGHEPTNEALLRRCGFIK